MTNHDFVVEVVLAKPASAAEGKPLSAAASSTALSTLDTIGFLTNGAAQPASSTSADVNTAQRSGSLRHLPSQVWP